MKETELSEATVQLEEDLTSHIASLPQQWRNVSLALNRQFEGRGNICDGWVDRFSPLTSLYPHFQAQALDGESGMDLRRLNLAHFLCILAGFLDDRFRDGQLPMSSDGQELTETFLEAGRTIIESLSRDAATTRTRIDRHLVCYGRVQGENYLLNESATDLILDRDRVRGIAAARAAHGFLAVLPLIDHINDNGICEKNAIAAYEHLVTGMQWIDDLTDFAEDYRSGEENLVLSLLRCALANEARDGLIFADDRELILALAEHDIISQASGEAILELEVASSLQLRLGCSKLAELIDQRAQHLSRSTGALARKRSSLIGNG